MPKKSKVFVVTKFHEEHNVMLETQYTLVARSRKEALEAACEEEGLIIQEKELYEAAKPARKESK